jgi:hypothetical protein
MLQFSSFSPQMLSSHHQSIPMLLLFAVVPEMSLLVSQHLPSMPQFSSFSLRKPFSNHQSMSLPFGSVAKFPLVSHHHPLVPQFSFFFLQMLVSLLSFVSTWFSVIQLVLPAFCFQTH